MGNILPTVGRMVYYKSRGSADGVFPPKDRSAVITDVESEPLHPEAPLVRLAVLNPEGLFFSDWLSQGQEPGQWDWMPFQKDQQARLVPGDRNTVWYGPHPCAKCDPDGKKGTMIVKAGNGAPDDLEYDFVHDSQYPNHVWQKHQHVA